MFSALTSSESRNITRPLGVDIAVTGMGLGIRRKSFSCVGSRKREDGSMFTFLLFKDTKIIRWMLLFGWNFYHDKASGNEARRKENFLKFTKNKN